MKTDECSPCKYLETSGLPWCIKFDNAIRQIPFCSDKWLPGKVGGKDKVKHPVKVREKTLVDTLYEDIEALMR
jgi:hypothetical protein